jgi:hypothetical protein
MTELITPLWKSLLDEFELDWPLAGFAGGRAKLSGPCGAVPRDSASYAFWCFQLRVQVLGLIGTACE